MDEPKYKRVLLKISGEALAGEKHFGLDFQVLGQVADVIKECVNMGVQIGVVIGGGNFWRGVKNGEGHIERTRADHMGMLATAMNCMALADVLEQKGVDVRLQTALEIREVAEPYIRARAVRHLEKGRVVLFGCGVGCPFFSTDTAAVLRAAEINADVILLAKNIDGVYDCDPAKNADAVKFDAITYDEVLKRHLAVMDSTATSLSMDNHIPVLVFALKDPYNIVRVLRGEKNRNDREGGITMLKEHYKVYEEKMKKSVEAVERDFGAVRAGRANASVLNRIQVDYYGTPHPIQQIAAVASPDPRTLLITPWDASALKGIEKAIQESDLGINPQNDGKSIRLAFPQLTEERRKELVKQIRKYNEGGKVAIRNIRRDALEAFKKMQKASEITEDELKLAEKDLQKMTDDHCKELDKLLDTKEKRNSCLSDGPVFQKKKHHTAGQVDENRLPRHIAVIMDGNGRWAKRRGLPRTAGHKVGGGGVPKNRYPLQGAGSGVPDGIRLLHGELEAPGGRGQHHHGPSEAVYAGGHRLHGAGSDPAAVSGGHERPFAGAAGAGPAHQRDILPHSGLSGQRLPELRRPG